MVRGLGADSRYWEALESGRLELPRCASCGHWRWPAPFRCPDCGSSQIKWLEIEPEGRVFTWTRAWHAFDGTESFPHPYVAALIELPQAGGIRLLGRFDESSGAPVIGAKVGGEPIKTEAFGRHVPAWCWRVQS